MVAFLWRSTFEKGPVAGFMAGLSDMMIIEGASGSLLYTVNGEGGGVQALRITERGLTYLDSEAYSIKGAGLSAPREMALIDMNGTPALAISGVYRPLIEAVPLQQSGALAEAVLLQMRGSNQLFSAMSHMVSTKIGDQTIFITASRQGEGISTWTLTSAGKLNRLVQDSKDVALLPANDISEMVLHDRGRQLLVLSSSEASLLRYGVDSTGQISLISRVGTAQGLAVSQPNALKVVTLEGQDYALVGGFGSNSLSVVQLRANGRMSVVDHVIDTLDTRFAGLSTLETFTIGGQVYILAAGRDEGLSLLALLPGGRLLHLTSLADSQQTGLRHISDIAYTQQGSRLEIFVAGLKAGSAEGSVITRLTLDLGQAGLQMSAGKGAVAGVLSGTAGRDILQGGSDSLRIEGGAGEDILIDGSGSDRLYGGAGADIFVLNPDGKTDYIMDFEPGLDRIDLSAMTGFQSLTQVALTPTAKGAQIRINNELLVIETKSGTTLDLKSLPLSDLINLPHYPFDLLDTIPAPTPTTPTTPTTPVTPTQPPITPPKPLPPDRNLPDVLGTSAADQLIGGSDSQHLIGAGGNDTLVGGIYDPIEGQVFRLYRAALARDPDAAGHMNWVRSLSAGNQSLVQAAGGFVNGPEFQKRYDAPDDTGFVTLLYRNVLEREPDAGGLKSWTTALASGRSRAEVLVGFSESTEFRNKTAGAALVSSHEGRQVAWVDDVYRLYRATLGREPDVGGLGVWTKQLANGVSYLTVVSNFIASAEFTKAYGSTTNADFITMLYRNVLGRDPDAAGFANWTKTLANGMSREQAVSGFAQSAEFIKTSANAMRAWGKANLPMDDEIEGGSGRNILFGGTGRDTFIFEAKNKATDHVYGFEAWDNLVLKGFDFTDTTDFRQSLSVVGNDVLFTDQGSQILFKDVTLATVLASDLYLI